MQQLFLDFAKQAENQVAGPMDRARVMTAAVAVAIVTSQHLPSSEVDSAEVYFTTQLMPLVQRLVSAFNEKVVFDVRACIEQVRQLWHLRYSAAFGNVLTMPNEEGGNFFDKFTGVDRFVSNDFFVFANTYSKQIISLSFFASMIINELTRGV